MRLVLTDEQRLLRESAARLVERAGGASGLRALREAGGAIDRTHWAAMAEAGWLGVVTSEEAGGLGLSATDLCLILEQAGRGLRSEPVAAVAVAARMVAACEPSPARDGLLGGLLSGERVVLPALLEEHDPTDPMAVRAEAVDDGDGLRLIGAKAFVAGAAAADGFIVSAHRSDGLALCHVAADADGVSIAAAPTADGGQRGTVALDDVAVPAEAVLAGPNRAPVAASAAFDLTCLALSAELLGVMGRALEIAVEYLKVREQFGRPIGSFQALQHRAVNDHIAVEATRSLVYQVAAAADTGRATPAMGSAAKARASAAALQVTKSAIQMHGAIGFTEEHDIGLYLKRAMTLASQHGNAAAHRRRYAALTGIETT